MRKELFAFSVLVLGTGLLIGTTPAAYASASPDARGNVGVAAYECDFVNKSDGRWYAGHYGGLTVIPSTTGVSAAGIEAQCLLGFFGFSPGGVDGIFGSNSQRAMRSFQEYVNDEHDAGLDEDGLPGPDSWPWLRKGRAGL